MISGFFASCKRLSRVIRKPKTVGFEELMQSVAGDEKYSRLVLWICRQNDFQRRSIIRTQLDILALKRAPSELRILFQSMEDPEFAAKVTEYLRLEGGTHKQ